MEPGSQYAQQYAPDAPTGWSPAPQAGTDAPPSASPAGYAPPTAPRARIGVIVLTALIVEILLIGGGANRWVSDDIVRHQSDSFRVRLIESSWLTYSWRFSSLNGQTSHWMAQLLLVLCVLVFSAAFIWCLLRGPVTWGRAFIGTWLAVLGATVVGGIVRGFVDPYGKFSLPRTDRVTRALFSGAGPSQVVIVGALGLGFVVAVITSIVAVASRRPAVAGYGAGTGPGPSAYPAPDPTFPDYAPPAATAYGAMRPWQDQHQAGPKAGPTDEPTTQLPAVPARESGNDSVDQPTTQLPAMRPPPPAEPNAPSDEPATTRFPRPPDDEDLGHIAH